MKTSEEKIDEYFEKFKSLLQQKKAIESVDQSSNSDGGNCFSNDMNIFSF